MNNINNDLYESLLKEKKYKTLLTLLSRNGDPEFLKSILIKNTDVLKELSKFGDYFLRESYIQNNLQMSQFLLGYGVGFNIKHMLYLHDNDISKKLQYIRDIRSLVTDQDFNEAFNLIVTQHSAPLKSINKQECYTLDNILLSITYSDSKNNFSNIEKMYKSLYDSPNYLIKDTLAVIAASKLVGAVTKIYIPMGENCYLNSAQVSDKRIYFPALNLSANEKGFFMHELAHQALDELFNNQARPYHSNDLDAIRKYNFAAKKSLFNIVSLYNKATVLNSDTLIEDETFSIRKALAEIYDKFPLHIFSLKALPNDKALHDRLARAYLGEHSMSDDQKYKLLNHYLDSVTNIYHFDEDTTLFLSRISELSLRDDIELDKELIARLVEFAAYELKPELLNLLEPLYIYWESEIHNKAEELRKQFIHVDCPADQYKISTIGEIKLSIDYHGVVRTEE